jgi:RNase P subunit RPR2
MEHIVEAGSNRYSCTECGKAIKKGEKFFRDSMKGWRASHTVNICRKCAIKMILEFDVEIEEIGEMRKEIILDRLENKKEKVYVI